MRVARVERERVRFQRLDPRRIETDVGEPVGAPGRTITAWKQRRPQRKGADLECSAAKRGLERGAAVRR
jgi:hypothetical protein